MPDIVDSGAVEQIASLLGERAGLRFDGALMGTLRRAVAASPDASSTEEYIARLGREEALLRELIDRVTVGETYFFRSPAQFDLLRTVIVPRLLEERRASSDDRPLRFWSAGCATGEEVYTLAIVLTELGIRSRVWILGTDINPRALDAARRGRYRQWSMRATPAAVVQRYFTRRGEEFELDTRIRELVDLRPLNLAIDEYPSRAVGVSDFDVVMCRNVLIYMTPKGGQDIGRRLVLSMREGGWLLPGASDPRLTDLPGAYVDVTAAGLVYRRAMGFGGPGGRPALPSTQASRPTTTPGPSAASGAVAGSVPESRTRDAAGSVAAAARILSGERARERRRTLQPRPLDGPSAVPLLPADPVTFALGRFEAGSHEAALGELADFADASAWGQVARALADRGDLEGARRTLEVALDRHPEEGALHVLNALVLGERDRLEDGIHAARAALYLDPRSISAHVTMATLLDRMGEASRARRSYQNALHLLDALDGATEVQGFPEEDAASIAKRLRHQLDARVGTFAHGGEGGA